MKKLLYAVPFCIKITTFYVQLISSPSFILDMLVTDES